MLSKRLLFLKSLASNLSVHIWDIGCDHGNLGLSFLESPQVQRIFLVDPSIDVITKLKQKVKDSYITNADKILILQKSGEDLNLEEKKIKTIFIAGMGGDKIRLILKNLINQISDTDEIILSPHRKVLELREYLVRENIFLNDEYIIEESNQFYQVISLTKNNSLKKIELFGSKEMWTRNNEATQYKNQQIRDFSLHRDFSSIQYVKYLRSLSP